MSLRNHLSSKDPTWRWWTGVFLMGFLRHLKIETWHLQTFIYLKKVHQEPPVLQGYNLEMVDRGLPDGLPDILDT